jgi:hypothetical protein
MLAKVLFKRLEHRHMITDSVGETQSIEGSDNEARNLSACDRFISVISAREIVLRKGLQSGRHFLLSCNVALGSHEHDRFSLPVPPGYEQCAASPASPRADFVASPLAMAALFDWEDEEDDEY